MAAADVVSLHCPLLPQTRGIVNASSLSNRLRKKGALHEPESRASAEAEDISPAQTEPAMRLVRRATPSRPSDRQCRSPQ
jgi:hypothetical protein